MSCPDCKDGFYYPLTGPREPCQTCTPKATVTISNTPEASLIASKPRIPATQDGMKKALERILASNPTMTPSELASRINKPLKDVLKMLGITQSDYLFDKYIKKIRHLLNYADQSDRRALAIDDEIRNIQKVRPTATIKEIANAVGVTPGFLVAASETNYDRNRRAWIRKMRSLKNGEA